MKLRHMCHENHTGPPANTTPIGTLGWSVYSSFVAEDGYGVDQSVLDAIEALNEAYHDDEYIPRQTEYDAITEWLETTAEEDGTWLEERNAKVARRSEIHAEIDVEWLAAADAARVLVGDTAYDAWLDAHDLLP